MRRPPHFSITRADGSLSSRHLTTASRTPRSARRRSASPARTSQSPDCGVGVDVVADVAADLLQPVVERRANVDLANDGAVFDDPKLVDGTQPSGSCSPRAQLAATRRRRVRRCARSPWRAGYSRATTDPRPRERTHRAFGKRIRKVLGRSRSSRAIACFSPAPRRFRPSRAGKKPLSLATNPRMDYAVPQAEELPALTNALATRKCESQPSTAISSLRSSPTTHRSRGRVPQARRRRILRRAFLPPRRARLRRAGRGSER